MPLFLTYFYKINDQNFLSPMSDIVQSITSISISLTDIVYNIYSKCFFVTSDPIHFLQVLTVQWRSGGPGTPVASLVAMAPRGGRGRSSGTDSTVGRDARSCTRSGLVWVTSVTPSSRQSSEAKNWEVRQEYVRQVLTLLLLTDVQTTRY